MSNNRSGWSALLLFAALILGAAVLLGACQPKPKAVTLTATTVSDGRDAVPGDGVCEMTAGSHDCSLRAAVDEANARSDWLVTIELPPGTYPLARQVTDDDTNAGGDLDIAPASRQLTIRSTSPGAVIDAGGNSGILDLRSGTIGLYRIEVRGATGFGVRAAAGTLVTIDEGASIGNGVGIDVAATSTVKVTNSTASGNGGSGIHNLGLVVMSFATVTDNGTGGIDGTGTNEAEASVIGAQRSGDDCPAPITSRGYNLSSDGSCQLGVVPGDRSQIAPLLGPLSTEPGVRFHHPQIGSPVIDAIPVSIGKCATSSDLIVDQRDHIRPFGMGCDIGSVEADFAFDFIVDDAGDAHDTTTTDGVCASAGGVCTLRAAIDQTNAASPTSGHTITLTVDPTLSLSPANEDINAGGDLDIRASVTIRGDGHTITGPTGDRVLQNTAATVGIDHLVLRGGQANGYGGGLLNTAGTMAISNSTVTANTAIGGGGGLAVTGGSVSVSGSAIAGNSAGLGEGGGVYVSAGTVTLANSTVAANQGQRGAAMNVSGGSLDMTASTVANNSGMTSVVALKGSVSVAGSILSTSGGGVCGSPLVSNGWNLVSDRTCGLGHSSDHQAVDPLLGALTDNGGPTPSMLPASNSTAVNAIPPGTLNLCDASAVTDQRGSTRPQGGWCDIGALEGSGPALLPLSVTVDTPTDGQDALPGDGVCAMAVGGCSLRAAVDETNAVASTDIITIAPGIDPVLQLSGTDDTNAGGDIDVTGFVDIAGNGVTIDANNIDRAFDLRWGRLAITDVTITRGRAGTGGGVRTQGGHLDLDRVRVVSSVATEMGGGVAVMTGSVTLDGATLEQNTAPTGAGIAVANASGITITRSVVRDNVLLYSNTSGGGISLSGVNEARIDRTTVAGNGSSTPNNGSRGGGVYLSGSTVTIERSTIRDNALGDGAGKGGGLFASGSTVTIHSSTVAGNSSMTGAGMHLESGTHILNHLTVADNDGWSSLSAPSTPPYPAPSISGSIITPRGGTACDGVFSSGGWNVVDDGSCGMVTGTDLPNTNPLLSLIGPNGGETDTILPFANAPTNDAIPADTPGLCDTAVGADQRGVPRPVGAGCDVGAVEGNNSVTATPRFLLVDDAADEQDATPGDGTCATGSGSCTLRAAIDEANHYPTADTITVSAGVNPIISRAGASDDANRTGDLDSWSTLVIEGSGATVNGGGLDGVIHQRARSLTLRNIAITGGNRPNGSRGFGGGLGASKASLTLENVEISGNVALPYHVGGGVSGADATITIKDSHIHDNQAYTGGGIGVAWGDESSVRVERSRVETNVAGNGGGIGMTSGHLTVTESTIDNNQGSDGGGIHATDGTIERSTVSNNTAPNGGALFVNGVFDVRTSTISGNDGAAISGIGGLTHLTSTTIAANESIAAIEPMGVYGNTIAVTMSGSIVDSQTGSACGPGVQATSSGYNVVVDSTCFAATPTDQTSTGAQLLPLADNGGSTLTHLLSSTSPAIDAIPTGTTGLCDASATVDQRNVAKPANLACDIGAVEGSGAAVPPLTMTVDSAADDPDANPGDGLCDTGTGSCTLRAAIDEANSSTTDDTITIGPGIDPVLTEPGIGDDANDTGDLDVFGGLVLHGNDQTLDGGQLDRVLDLHAGSVEIDRLTMRGGRLTDNYTEGGGIRVSAGDLTLDRVRVIENRIDTYQSNGGALLVRNANVTVVDSLFSGNTAYSGSGVWAQSGTVQIRRSTFARNTNNVIANQATMVLDNVTITENIGVVVRQDGGTLDITHSTLVRNVAAWTLERANGVLRVSGSAIDGGGGRACSVGLSSGAYNVVSDYSCASSEPSRPGVDLLVGPLDDHGGATPTVLPLAGSPLLDLVPVATTGLCDATTPIDQRGTARPSGSACDAGSVEGVGPAPTPLNLTVDSALDAPDANRGDGICATETGVCTLRAAFTETNDNAGTDTITISPGVEPTSSILGTDEDLNQSGDLDQWGDLVIEGGSSTIHGNRVDRVIHHLRGRLEMRHLTVEGGRLTGPGLAGGGILANDDLDLDHVTVRDNQLTGPSATGAGLATWSGSVTLPVTVTVRSSSIIRNTSAGDGGGLTQFSSATVVVTTSTISSNTAPNGSAIRSEGGVQLVASTVWANNGASLIIGSVTTSGSVLAFAVGTTCTAPATSGGWNLSVDSSCGLNQPSDHQNTPHKLGALSNNGGETLTHKPTAGAVEINAIPNGTAGLCDGSIPLDQRGSPRPVGAACDIGSVEQ